MDIQVVLIILGILYYLFRPSGKQKKANAPRPKSDHNPTPSIEDILRELTGQTQVVPPPKLKKPATVKIKPEPVAAVNVASENQPRRVRPQRQAENQYSTEEVEKEEVVFDLRQAIINDAILNRPYR